MDDELTEEHMANLPTVVLVKKKYRVGKHPPAEEAKEEEEEDEDEDDAGAVLVPEGELLEYDSEAETEDEDEDEEEGAQDRLSEVLDGLQPAGEADADDDL